MADQAKSYFSNSLTEWLKTGLRGNFFVHDVVLPIDALCSANHLPMIDNEHLDVVGLRGRNSRAYAAIVSTGGFECSIFSAFDQSNEKST